MVAIHILTQSNLLLSDTRMSLSQQKTKKFKLQFPGDSVISCKVFQNIEKLNTSHKSHRNLMVVMQITPITRIVKNHYFTLKVTILKRL